MLKAHITVQHRLLPAIILAVCSAYFYAPSSYGQSEVIASKSDSTTASLIEKLIDGGQLKEAREKLRVQVAKEGECPRLLLLEAMILYRENQYQDSLRKLERVLSLQDGDPDVYKLIGLNLVLIGRDNLAGSCFEKAITLSPRDFRSRYYLCLYQLTGREIVSAETTCRMAIQLNPQYLDGYLALGVAQEHLGKQGEAIQTYLQACELAERQGSKTETPFLYFARLLISMQRFEQSLPQLRKAVAINPKSPEALTALGQTLSRLGQYDEAIQSLQDAARLAPQDKTPHYALIGIYQKLRRTEDAQREMSIFRALEEKENKK